MASITIVVGPGTITSGGLSPGHVAIQVTKGDETTYLGMGPSKGGLPYTAVGQYDVITLPTGVSPVGALHGPFQSTDPNVAGEYHYVDTLHYPNTKSFTWQISDSQADAAINKAYNYQLTNTSYNFATSTICSDYALSALQAAIPGSNVVAFSRIPEVLLTQLTQVVANGTFVIGDLGATWNPNLSGIQQDIAPPNFNVLQQFNDVVPFNYASGTVEGGGGASMQFALAKLSDGSGTL